MKRRGLLASAAALLGLPLAPRPRIPYGCIVWGRWNPDTDCYETIHRESWGEMTKEQERNLRAAVNNLQDNVMDIWEDRHAKDYEIGTKIIL